MATAPTPSPTLDARSLTPRREVDRTRQIFVNRNMRFDKVDMIGFDMDHTLAIYQKRRSEELAFEMTLARLVSAKGYPPDVGSIQYDPAFVIRGLIIDKHHGHIIKADRHSHVGRCYHGRRSLEPEARKALYLHERIRLGTSRYAWIDTLFSLPEACLYAGVIDLLEARGTRIEFPKLYEDIRDAIDSVHRDGTLKAVIQKNIGDYIKRDPELGPALHKLRSGGKKLFVATNSFWEYTEALMSYMLDGVLPEYPRWQSYFDYVVVGAQKPAFFSESRPFLELDAQGRVVGEVSDGLERGKIYQGGNLIDLERFAGIAGDRVLYVGDHIYGDILRSKKSSLWRTCMIVEELEDELAHTAKHADDIRRLHELDADHERLDDEVNHLKHSVASLERRLDRESDLPVLALAELEGEWRAEKAALEKARRLLRDVRHEGEAIEARVEKAYNPYWGLIFKEGQESSRFGEQVEDYACLYTSRVSNFLAYSPAQYFRAPRQIMSHERG
jgi:HAD superfamily 5'-nucleotidase-like hydrolase